MKIGRYIVIAAIIGLAIVFAATPLIMVKIDSSRLKTEIGEIIAAERL